MKGLRFWLRDHPLVWTVPLLMILSVLVISWYLAYEIARTPDAPFIYNLW